MVLSTLAHQNTTRKQRTQPPQCTERSTHFVIRVFTALNTAPISPPITPINWYESITTRQFHFRHMAQSSFCW